MAVIRESIRQGVRSLSSSILRTTLTLLGMVIGVSSVIIMLTVGTGAQKMILSEIEGLGSNLLFAMAGGEDSNLAMTAQLRILLNSDVDALRRPGALPSVIELSPFTRTTRVQIKEGINDEVGVPIWGVDPEYFTLQNIEIEEGRIWTAEEQRSEKKVVVVGGSVDETIFGEDRGPLVGKRLRIRGQTYTIVGVIKKQEGLLSSFGNENNEYLFVPTPVAQKLLVDSSDFVWGIAFKARDEKSLDSAKEEIRTILRRQHRLRDRDKDDFTLMSQDQFVEILTIATSIFTAFLSSLAGISLLVGGIGIMNIMLVVVTERIPEIGIRKAMGARRRDILLQFLIEAMVITLVGGVLGVGFGLLISYIFSVVGGFTFSISIPIILLACSGSALFGIVFGLWPALRASKLDPILAIRHR